jgi:predicted nucleic acid-binding protein
VDTVYIETSIPSTYFEQRTAPKMVARRDWTRDWWDNHRQRYHLVTSDPVFDELTRADHPLKQEKLDLLAGVELLEIPDDIGEIVEVYLQRYVMPRDPTGDALHLALASYHKCDVLLTWNCQHLANLNKLGHIRRVNTLLGLHVPQLVTPLELLGEDCT